MPHCPNPECRHRKHTGKPAEYRVGVERCGDCGAVLAPGAPQRRAGPRPGWPAALVQRLAITAGALLLVWMAQKIPHPLLDGEAQRALWDHGVVPGPLALGIRPLVVAFILVELGALALPHTRRRRRTDPTLRVKLWLLAALLGVGIAWLQGLSMALTLEAMNGPMGWGAFPEALVPNPGWAFRLSTAALIAAGTGAMAVVARWLDRHGLGPGMAALLLLDALLLAGKGLWQHGQEIHLGAVVPLVGVLVLLALGACLWGVHWLLGRQVRLAGGMPVVLPTSGLEPIQLPAAILGLAWGLASFGGDAASRILDDLLPGRPLWYALSIATVVVAVPLTSTLYYWRRRGWWTGPERPRWLAMQALTVAALLAFVLFEGLLASQLLLMAGGGLLSWIVLVALLGDLRSEIRAWRVAPGGELQVLAEHQDVADALEELDRRQRQDPDGHYALAGLRYRSTCYFFGPFVPLRILGRPSTHSKTVEE